MRSINTLPSLRRPPFLTIQKARACRDGAHISNIKSRRDVRISKAGRCLQSIQCQAQAEPSGSSAGDDSTASSTPQAGAPDKAGEQDTSDTDDSSDEELEDNDVDDESSPALERNPLSSRLITQEVLLFCFQQDVESALMRALNMDDMDRAQILRERLQTIDAAIQQIQKLKESEKEGPLEETSQEDSFATSFRLRSSLQDAIMAEKYEEAAKLRDELKVLQERLDEASGKAEKAKERLEQQRSLRLGQRVLITNNGHRGVVCGWDASCTETEEWQEDAGVNKLEMGGNQPFYQVLIDWKDAYGGFGIFSQQNLIAYVAQDMLSVPEPSKTWIEAYGSEDFQNPYCFKMFLGNDECGDYLPCRALRDKYGQERRDVQPPESLQNDEDEDNSEQRLQELLELLKPEQGRDAEPTSDSDSKDVDGGYTP